MSSIVRFGVSLDKKLLDDFDKLIQRKGYKNRSEAIRDLIRESLVEEEWESGTEIIGCITIVYDHHVRKLSEELLKIQHDHYLNMLSTLHLHLDHHNCLEVIVVKGKSNEVKSFSDIISGQRGVKFSKLTAATTGRLLV
ncbi:nickel-responsive regulator [bacterium SM23_31]|nr:MAG: nickel-responsive regulator [bacterium SM23_31]